MGVRARIADWPPKRDATKDSPASASPCREAAGSREATGNREAACCRGFPSGPQPLGGISGFPALPRLSRRRSKDVEFQEGWPRSPAPRGLAPLRHRSSSEVTLSECDPEETVTEPR
ncbi:SI1L3 protein, partial [Glaucidium brasilianum]|nr:SI1L3 protein [Glaucidium brasilianum]